MTTRQRQVFGSVRELDSGRFQARYESPTGERMSAGTHHSEKLAHAALALVQADLLRGTWDDPTRGKVAFGRYARETLDTIELKDTTRGEYRANLRNHLLPSFENKNLRDITYLHVKRWWQSMPEGSARRNSYTVLSRILREALDDELITTSPCRVRGAFTDTSKPRGHMPIAEFEAIVDEVPEQLRPLYWLIYGGSLRLAEAVALRRSDLDLDSGVIHVTKSVLERKGQRIVQRTKNRDHRHPTLPEPVIRMMRDYLHDHPRIGSAPLFDAPRSGKGIGRNLIQRNWARTRVRAGFPQHHLHDARHSSLTLAVEAGASLREVMARGGHRTPTAALRYQHAVAERDRTVASGMGNLMQLRGRGSQTPPALGSSKPARAV